MDMHLIHKEPQNTHTHNIYVRKKGKEEKEKEWKVSEKER